MPHVACRYRVCSARRRWLACTSSWRSRDANSWPSRYVTRSKGICRSRGARMSHHLDLMRARIHERGGTQYEIAALSRTLVGKERHRRDMVDAGHFVDHAQDFRSIDRATERPAEAVWAADQGIEKLAQRGQHAISSFC